MKRFLLAAAIVLLASLEARAETLWVGNAFLTTVTQGCGKVASVGDSYRAIYRPSGTSLGNGADSHLSLTSTRANFILQAPNNRFQQNINYVAQTVGSTLKIGSHSGAILIWDEAGGPNNISLTTRLTKFFGVKACKVTIQVYFTKLPAS